MSRPSELLLSQIWQAQWLRRTPLRTEDGRVVRVVYRGQWSHGLGPDFRAALLVFDDGPLLRGDIELHRQAVDWQRHGHERDPRYAEVILHVTLEPGGRPAQRLDGTLLPQLALQPYLPAPIERFVPTITATLGTLGIAPCAGPRLATAPDELRQLLRQAGLARLQHKAAIFEASLSQTEAAQCFYSGLLDALGYSQNREPCRQLADQLPLTLLDAFTETLPAAVRRQRLAAILLGAAGFLPYPAALAQRLPASLLGSLQAEHERLGALTGQPPPAWQLGRLRPANHPAQRLLGLASLLAADRPSAFPATSLARLQRHADSPRALCGGFMAALWSDPTVRLIGAGRAQEIVVNLLIPFALAVAAQRADTTLATAAMTALDRLPAGAGNPQTRVMRDQLAAGQRFPIRSALEQQGLIHLYRAWCHSRRCYQCPVAHTALTATQPR